MTTENLALSLAAELVKKFEGLFLAPYFCPAGVKTVGYGHAIAAGNDDFDAGISLELAEVLLKRDLAWAMLEVCRANPDLMPGQCAALGSLVFNIGPGAWRKSTICKLVKAGELVAAAGQFKRWNQAGGKVLAGLVARRAAEEKLFRGEK